MQEIEVRMLQGCMAVTIVLGVQNTVGRKPHAHHMIAGSCAARCRRTPAHTEVAKARTH